MTTAINLVKGSMFRLFNFVISIGIAFFMMPFLVHNLGEKWYGFWTLVATFVGYYGFLDLGLASATGRFLARAVGKKDKNEINQVVNTSFYLYNFIAVASVLVTIVIASGSFFVMEPGSERTSFILSIILVGMSFSLSISVRAISGILSAHLRYDISAGIDLVMMVLKNALLVYVVSLGHKIVAIACVTLISCIIEIFIISIAVKRVFPALSISREYVDKTKIKDLFNYGGFTFIAQIADHLRFNVDNFVVSAFLGVSAVTVYAIPSRLAQYFIQLVVQALGMMTPVFSRYEGNNDFDSIREKFLFFTKISMIFVLPVGYAIVLIGKAFIVRWMGAQYEDTYSLLVVFIIPLMIALMQTPSVGVLYGISKHKFYALFNSIEGVANLIVSIVLARQYGLMGVALGTALPMLVIKIFIQPVYVTRCIGLSLKSYAFLVFRVCSYFGGLAVLIYYAMRPFIIAQYGVLFITGIVVCVGSWAILFILILNQKEKNHFIRLVTSRVKAKISE